MFSITGDARELKSNLPLCGAARFLTPSLAETIVAHLERSNQDLVA